MKYFKYFFFLPASIALLVASCSKSTTSTAETSGDWVHRTDANFSGRSEAVNFVIGNYVYVGTGFDNYASNYPGINTAFYDGGKSNDLFRFDPAANTGAGSWKQLSNMIDASLSDTAAVRSSAVAFVCNGKGYVTTGMGVKYRLQDTWEYNPGTNLWTRKMDLPDENPTIKGSGARFDAVGFSLKNLGYIAGGYSNRDLADLWQFDPNANNWTAKTGMAGSGRSSAVAFTYHDSLAYVVTGKNNGATLKDFIYYNPTTDSWGTKRNITNTSADAYDDDYTDIIRYNAVAFVLGDNAYLTTGQSSGYTSKTWVYDINGDQWTRKTPYQRSLRDGAIGFTVNGRCFVGLGSGGGSYFNNMSEFQPDVTYNSNDDTN